MGHTASIRCPACSCVIEYELKEVEIDELNETVSFELACDCGFARSYDNLVVAELPSVVSSVPESQEITENLGISRESYESYVWPPDIRKTIDKQRRDLPNSATKRVLRSSALDLPRQHNDRWWLVYDTEPQVVFDPKADTYGLVLEGGAVSVIGNITAIVSSLDG